MKSSTLALAIIALTIYSCSKMDSAELQQEPPVAAPCIGQTGNPAGKSYTADSVVAYTCTSRHCGIIPMSAKNFWIYEDSIFQDGNFLRVQLDTLRFTSNRKSLSDELVWWEATINVGLPEWLYANDSAIFSMNESWFLAGQLNSRREFGQISADSARYLSAFEDIAAQAKTIKLTAPVSSPAGTWNDCLYFEKYSRNYRKDQVFFEPGIGVIRYVHEMAAPGTSQLRMQQVSRLVSYHLE